MRKTLDRHGQMKRSHGFTMRVQLVERSREDLKDFDEWLGCYLHGDLNLAACTT
ncbi:MAG: hypothetical protein ACO1OX_10280 [Novosphingobium sp.]